MARKDASGTIMAGHSNPINFSVGFAFLRNHHFIHFFNGFERILFQFFPRPHQVTDNAGGGAAKDIRLCFRESHLQFYREIKKGVLPANTNTPY